MKTDGLYPTIINWTSQNFEATTPIIGSSDTGSLAISDPELTDAYWIGWANFDDLPAPLKITRYRADTDAGAVVCENAMMAENVDICMLSVANQLNYEPSDKEAIAQVFKNNVWSQFSKSASSYNTSRVRFLNKFDVNTVLMMDVFLQLAITIDDASECMTVIPLTPENLYTRAFSYTLTSSAIARFAGANVPNDLSIKITNDNINGKMQTVTSNGHTIKYVCCCFGIKTEDRPITTAGTRGGYWAPAPVVRVHSDRGRSYLIGGQRYYQYYGTWQQAGYLLRRSNGALYSNGVSYLDGVDNIILGGFLGTMPFSDLVVFPAYGMIESDGNFCAIGVGDMTYAKILMMYTWDDICDTLSLQMRYGSSNTYATDDDKYYAKISPDNQFLFRLANGETDFADLRPWQIVGATVNASTNRYTPDDKPPYTPGGDDDDEKIGDSIGFNINVPGGTASGLYTMYALRQAHVSNLGAALWTSFNSPDSNFWQNVRMAAGLYEEAGSFDLSTILDYIASIRIYPFALINLPGYTGAGTGAIKMGTGKIPLDLSTGGAGNVGIMGSYTGIIDAGSVSIPSHYGDFRDLEGVTMSIYLPYIGNVTLNPAEVTGQTLQATYAVDLTSGSCVAYLLLSGTWGYYPIGVYSGTIGADIPLTASQGNRMFLRDLKNVVGLGSILGGSLSGVDATDGDALAGAIGSGLASGAAYMAKNVYRQGMGSALTPPTLGGGGANFAGFGAPQTAYVQIRRHLYAYNAQTFPASHMGRRSYGVHTLGTLSGFTICDAVDVSGIPAPADIQTDIKKALESGVYL